MKKLEMVKQALSELPSASLQEMSDFIRDTHGAQIDPPVIAVIRAMLLDEQLLDQYRQAARELVERAKAS